MNAPENTYVPRVWFFVGVCLLLLLQVAVRFSVQPSVGCVLDDWSYWSQAEKFPSAAATLIGGLRHPLRPFLHGVQLGAHRALGCNAVGFAVLSATGYSLSLCLFVLLVLELSGNRMLALVSGVLFALLPNLCGHFHWLCVAVGMEFGCLANLFSAWSFARYARRGERRALAMSVLGYFVGIGTYEIGVFFPAAYGVLLWGRGLKKWILSLLPFAVALAAYATWRLTAGFGWGWSWFGIPPQTAIGMSLWELKQTLAGVVSWWGGLNWWRAVADGAGGFAELPWSVAAALVVSNTVLLAVLGWVLAKLDRFERENPVRAPFGSGRLALFGMVWVAAAYLPAFLGYLVPRVNYLPGIGMAFLAASALGRLRMARWLVPLLLLAFAGMVVGEGDTKNWSDSIRFQRNLYETMESCRSGWENEDVLWLDTRELAQRMTPGILAPARHHIDTIAEYRNVGFLRGFAPSAMAALILKGTPGPQVVLDVEYGAHEENGVLKWHERYNADKPLETPMNRVFRLDVFKAGTEGPSHAEPCASPLAKQL